MAGDDIRIRVLIDNARGTSGLRSQWGLSFWIETPDARVLLDCGGSGAFLQKQSLDDETGVHLHSLGGAVI